MARRKIRGAKPNGHTSNDGLPPDEVFSRHLDKIRPAVGKLNRIVETARQQRAAVGKLYAAAEKDGCNRKGFTAAVAILAKPTDEVALQQRTTGRVLRVAEHPLVTKYGLFADLPLAAKPVSPYAAGQTVGRAGGSLDECPHKPGSENFIEWRDGHESGQRVNQESLRQTSLT